MAIQFDVWWPDTCNCAFIIQYDDTDPNKVTSFSSALTLDIFHSLLSDATTAFNTVNDENKRKNGALQTLIDNLSTQLSSTGTAGGTLKDGITYNFTLTGTAPNRVLNVSFNGITLTNQQRNRAQTFCDNKFGVGKVIVS